MPRLRGFPLSLGLDLRQLNQQPNTTKDKVRTEYQNVYHMSFGYLYGILSQCSRPTPRQRNSWLLFFFCRSWPTRGKNTLKEQLEASGVSSIRLKIAPIIWSFATFHLMTFFKLGFITSDQMLMFRNSDGKVQQVLDRLPKRLESCRTFPSQWHV